jgi:hypothetical protein
MIMDATMTEDGQPIGNLYALTQRLVRAAVTLLLAGESVPLIDLHGAVTEERLEMVGPGPILRADIVAVRFTFGNGSAHSCLKGIESCGLDAATAARLTTIADTQDSMEVFRAKTFAARARQERA